MGGVDTKLYEVSCFSMIHGLYRSATPIWSLVLSVYGDGKTSNVRSI